MDQRAPEHAGWPIGNGTGPQPTTPAHLTAHGGYLARTPGCHGRLSMGDLLGSGALTVFRRQMLGERRAEDRTTSALAGTDVLHFPR